MMRPDNDQQNNDKHTQERQNRNAQAQSELAAQDQARPDQDAPDRAEPSMPKRRRAAPVAPTAPTVVSPTPNVCARLTPDLKAYQDGQMGWWQRWSVGRHLTRCAACREELEAMREFSDRWRGVDAEALDPALRARILAAVPDTRPAVSAGSAASRLRPRPLLLAGAGLSAAVGAIALYPVVTRNAHSAEDAAKSTDATFLSAPTAGAGQAQKRMESYAAAPANVNGAAASGFAAPVAETNSAAANPTGTQIADARQFPADKSGGAPGEPEPTARDRNREGNTFGINQNKGAQVTAEAGAASPSASIAATEAPAGSAVPIAPGALGGNATPTTAMGKTSASSPAPSSAPSPKPATEAARDPFKASDKQAAASPVQSKPDAQRNPDDPRKVVQHARIADGLPTDKTAQNGGETGKAVANARDVAKASVSHYGAPAYARPPVARRADSTQANSMQTDADTPVITLKLRVERAETAAADIEKHTRAIGGMVVVSETTDAGGAKSATLKLKAPTANLDALVAQIGRTGTILSQTMLSTRSTGGTAATHANAFPAQPQNGSRRQTVAYTNVTVLLQSR